MFQTNGGTEVTLGGEIPIEAGDLLIWRYGNLHSVENVKSADQQFGFMRILYPIHDLIEQLPKPVPLPRRMARRLRSAASRGRAILGGIKRRVF